MQNENLSFPKTIKDFLDGRALNQLWNSSKTSGLVGLPRSHAGEAALFMGILGALNETMYVKCFSAYIP